MKKILKKVFIFCIILLISGCDYNGSDLSTSDTYLDQLSNDVNDIDFFLGGQYYKLPCEVKEFQNNGWSCKYSETEKYGDGDKIILEPLTQLEIYFSNSNYEASIKLLIINDSNEAKPISNAKVVSLEISTVLYISTKIDPDKYNDDFFVTKEGVTLLNSIDKVKKAYKGLKGYNSEGQVLKITNDNNLIEMTCDKKHVRAISLSVKDSQEYSKYVNEEARLKQKAKFKIDAEENAKKYLPNNYDELFSIVDTKKLYFKGVIIEKTEEIITTANNKVYCYIVELEDKNIVAIGINTDNIDIQEKLTVGETIEAWAYTRGAYYYNEKKIVVFNPTIVNKDNIEIIDEYSIPDTIFG